MSLLWTHSNVHVLPVPGTPELDGALQMMSHQGGAEGQNPLSHPAGCVALYTAQDTTGFLGCQYMFLGYVQPLIHQQPQNYF